MDDDGSGDLNEAEFCKAMSYKGIELAPAEVSTIFGRYDADGSGGIGYEEFIRALRGTMNAKRKDVCRLAFGRFDRDGSGEITVDDMVGVFSAQRHPDVIAGRKTERDVLRMKLAQFDKVGAGGQAGDGRVTMPEFLEYYALHVSPSIDNDEHFCLLVRKAWGLDDGEVAGQRSARGRPDIATTVSRTAIAID
jgi:Ca2+-binding EF-hand superfamily protein